MISSYLKAKNGPDEPMNQHTPTFTAKTVSPAASFFVAAKGREYAFDSVELYTLNTLISAPDAVLPPHYKALRLCIEAAEN